MFIDVFMYIFAWISRLWPQQSLV